MKMSFGFKRLIRLFPRRGECLTLMESPMGFFVVSSLLAVFPAFYFLAGPD
jgi:hypothetical protein